MCKCRIKEREGGAGVKFLIRYIRSDDFFFSSALMTALPGSSLGLG